MLDRILSVVEKYIDNKSAKLENNSNILDYGIDSLGVINMVMELENIFGVHFEDEEIVSFRTPEDLEKIILNKIS
jgi:acyl carrier protein